MWTTSHRHRPGVTTGRRRVPPRVGAFAGAALVAVLATPVAALEVTRSRDVAASPAAVWSIVGGFCDIVRWHPLVEGCTLGREDGAPVRSIVAAGGLGTIVEIETARDEAAMRYGYRFVAGPLPVRSYAAALAVTPNGAGARITWTATFEAKGMTDADAVADIADVYERGLAGIAREAAP